MLLKRKFKKKKKKRLANEVSPRVRKPPHICKKRASWLGLTMPGMWAPSVFSKLATSTYLWRFSSLGSASGFGFGSGSGSELPTLDLSFRSKSLDSVAVCCGRAGSHVWPSSVPRVRYSWARYPARSWLESTGWAALSEPANGTDGLGDFVSGGFNRLGSKSSLSLRLLVGMETRRGGKRIVLVFMIPPFMVHATSAKFYYK
ncbi:hypothetical protein GQ457_11G003340 [Hibiscus cannabinus]